jgi:hypothetical protein
LCSRVIGSRQFPANSVFANFFSSSFVAKTCVFNFAISARSALPPILSLANC